MKVCSKCNKESMDSKRVCDYCGGILRQVDVYKSNENPIIMNMDGIYSLVLGIVSLFSA